MNTRISEPSATVAAMVGLLALASAMGIGRFSLTPILPLMQRDMGLTFARGDHHWKLSGVPGRRADLHGLRTSTGTRDPLGPDLRRCPYCGDGT